jgi:hypothetical protein
MLSSPFSSTCAARSGSQGPLLSPAPYFQHLLLTKA